MEFKKYDKLGAYHWDEFKQQTIYGQHAKKVIDWVDGDNILDIGAGDGLITYMLNKKGLNCIGIDNNNTAVKLAQRKNSPVLLGDAYNINYRRSSFDSVLMADVIEHFEFPEKVMHEINRVLKPDGILYITTPPKKKDGSLHDKYHYKEYSIETLHSFIQKFNFELVEPMREKYVRIYAKFKKI